MGTVLSLILLCQGGMNSSPASANVREVQGESPAYIAREEHELILRYNGLARALNDFVAAYRAGQVDLKKARAVRKALQDMEKFEWFKPTRSQPGSAPEDSIVRE
jgi:hypothetical protein